MIVDVNRPSTWKKYQEENCLNCMAGCCSLPVEMSFDDLVRLEFVDEFERDEPRRKTAKRLKKEGLISHYNNKNDIYTLPQRSNEDCVYLDQQTRRCQVYEKRPKTCRQHPIVGPRRGFCAYVKKKS